MEDFCFFKSAELFSETIFKINYKIHVLLADSLKYEKVIMLPRMESYKEAIFTPRLIAFNETFAPLKKQGAAPVTFHEAISGRKSNDILSSIVMFLMIPRRVLLFGQITALLRTRIGCFLCS